MRREWRQVDDQVNYFYARPGKPKPVIIRKKRNWV
jgi:hypothetical protein